MAYSQAPEWGDEHPEYFYTEDVINPVTEQDFLLLLQTPDASTLNAEDDCSLLEQFSWGENDSAYTPETSEENKKRKISTEEGFINDTAAQRRLRSEIWRTNGQVAFDFSENGNIKPDSQTNEIVLPSYISLDPGSPACIYSEFLNYDESIFKTPELKVFDYFGEEKNLSVRQCTARKIIFQKEDTASEVKDTYISKAAQVCSVDNLAVPGTSHSLENNSISELNVKKVQNVSPLQKQPPVEMGQTFLSCLSCHGTASEHVKVLDGKAMHRCCRCSYIHENFSYLQIHCYYEHAIPSYCNVCQIKYSEVKSHAPDQMCYECNQNFECKYQLEKHYLSAHERFNRTHCRICKEVFDKHFSRESREYLCCECKTEKKQKGHLMSHLYKHFPLKIYECEVCGKHLKYPKYIASHLKDYHPLCEFCKKRFLNIHFLYKHLQEEHSEE